MQLFSTILINDDNLLTCVSRFYKKCVTNANCHQRTLTPPSSGPYLFGSCTHTVYVLMLKQVSPKSVMSPGFEFQKPPLCISILFSTCLCYTLTF